MFLNSLSLSYPFEQHVSTVGQLAGGSFISASQPQVSLSLFLIAAVVIATTKYNGGVADGRHIGHTVGHIVYIAARHIGHIVAY